MSLLKVENISYRESETLLLDGLSFEINEKGIYAILSKNKKAKTALAKALSGVVTLSGGKIIFKDVELSQRKDGIAAKAKIGYMPSECFFYPDMTVCETLDFTGRMRKTDTDKRVRQIKAALEFVFLTEKADALVKDLTASEKKRLALANTLVGNPSLLVLDDPMAGVNSEDRTLISDIISSLSEKKAVVILTDRVGDAKKLASTVGILSNKKIALWETVDEIKERLSGDEDALFKTYLAFSEDEEEGGR